MSWGLAVTTRTSLILDPFSVSIFAWPDGFDVNIAQLPQIEVKNRFEELFADSDSGVFLPGLDDFEFS